MLPQKAVDRLNPRVEPETLETRLSEAKAAMRYTTSMRMYERYQCTFQGVLFEDESMILDYQALENTWFPRGSRRLFQRTGNTMA